MIRLPDIPNLNGQAINAPAVSAGAMAAPAEGLGKIASAIAGVSETFHDTAIQIQKITNARTISERNQKLAAEWSAFELDLQKDHDPASRIQRTRDWLASAQNSLISADDPPAVADELTNRFGHFANTAFINVARDSAVLEERRAALALSNEIDSAIQHGNRAAADDALDRWAKTGTALPEQVAQARRRAYADLSYLTYKQAIASNPLESERRLNDPTFSDPDLTPEQLDSLRSESERSANRYRSDFTNDIIISGSDPTPEDLAEMEAAGQIDKSTHARWLTQIREKAAGAEPPHDDAIYEQTYTQVMTYDPAADLSGRGLAHLRSWIASQALPKSAIQVLNSKLNDRLNPATSDTPKGKTEGSFFSKIDTDFTRGDFGKYRFPVDHDNDPSTAPITPINREEYDKAWRLRGQFTEEWRKILGTMPPEATFDQINTAYEALKKSFKDRKPLPDISFSKPANLPFDPEGTYQKVLGTFGGQSVKPPGVPYTGAAATVFGGPNDPADNGKSAFGGATGPGGKEGAAIPQKLLAAKFPGRDKAWLSKNARTIVRAADGSMHSFPVVDLGTAEWVWKKNQRPTLDLTEGAARQIGGKPIYTKDGKLTGLAGVPTLDFAVVSIDTGNLDLAKATWPDAKDAWFRANKPRTNTEALNGLFALREAWSEARGTVENMPLTPDKVSAPELIPNYDPANPGQILKMGETTGDPIIDANLRIAEEATR